MELRSLSLELRSLSREQLEAMQLECSMAPKRSWVAGVEYRGSHQLLPSRLEVVQDHNVAAPGLPSSCRDLRSDCMLIEAEIDQLTSSCDTLLLSHEKAQGG
jgi:hypothetical protein